MTKRGFIGRAIIAGAVFGGLAGYTEAVLLIVYSRLYFTAAGKIGLLLAAPASYAVYGMAATVLISFAWRVLMPRHDARAVYPAAVFSIALLYSVAILLFGIPSRSGPFSARFFLCFAGLMAASVVTACLFGWIAGTVLKMRGWAAAAACAVFALGIWAFVPGKRDAQPGADVPSVVLVTIDTIRADRICCYGHEPIETPTMDRLASVGALFENAISQIPVTNPSHLSILSSRYPHELGVMHNRSRRPPGISTIVDEFARRGYRTAAFVSAFPLESRFGFAEGFEIYDDSGPGVKGFQGLSMVRIAGVAITRGWGLRAFRRLMTKRDARETNSEVLSWLRSRAKTPFFLWVHYFDPHGPYAPPSPYSGMYYKGVKDDPNNHSMEGIELPPDWTPGAVDFTDINYPVAQYDAEITYTDAELGRLVEELDAWIGEEYLLVVVGDHGESLTEHDLYFRHDSALYDEHIRVPLILRMKGKVEPVRLSSPVENIDIAPTILELAGIDIPAWYRGKSLVPVMRGDAASKEGALSETGGRKRDGTVDFAYRDDRYKLIVKPGADVELYDLQNDPRELRNISKERGDLIDKYRERILSLTKGQAMEASSVMDYETEGKLRSLGYIR
ncbi:MAG: sulfatase-like hydrolase/transferase [Candidatus Tritonobacter lacicola]|nr:sulfatase-like hydrolase/transferase [Candidatus Tritonobacter lacicola]